MKLEVWRDIPGYKNYYQVSDEGRVRSLDRTIINSLGRKRFYKGKFFEGSLHNGGYKILTLSKGGKIKHFLIHQLVAMAFLGHKPDGHSLVIDHIDGDRTNDNVDNLRIVTNRDNTSTCHRSDRNVLSSELAGVYWFKDKWRAKIVFKNKNIYLGQFDSEINASNAYQDAFKNINDNTFNPDKYKPKFYSKYKGVYFDKSRQKWFAKYTHNGKQKYLGSFKTEQEAYQKLLEFEACTLVV